MTSKILCSLAYTSRTETETSPPNQNSPHNGLQQLNIWNMTKTVKKTYLVAAVYKGGEEKKSTENAMLVNRRFLSSSSTTCVSLEEERKQKKKNVYRVFNRNFCSEKKLQEKKPQRRKKKRGRMQRRSRKVTKCTPSHPGSLSLSPSTRRQQQQQQRESFGLVPPNPKLPNPQFHPTGVWIFRVLKKPWLSSNKGTREIYIRKRKKKKGKHDDFIQYGRVSIQYWDRKRGFLVSLRRFLRRRVIFFAWWSIRISIILPRLKMLFLM